MKSVLILDANMRSALAVTRSLGNRGVRVYTADESISSLSGSSRYCHRYFRYPSAKTQMACFVDAVVEICLTHHIDILIPVTELTAIGLLKHRNRFSETILPFADFETVDALADKCRLVCLAEELGVPIPRSRNIKAGSISEKELSGSAYPSVLKPGVSWTETDHGWDRASVRIVNSEQEAISLTTEDFSFRHRDYLLQDYVAGHGAGIFAIYNQGEPIAFFAHRRLREKPPDGGVSVLSVSVDPDPKLLDYARKILDRVNWHGIAMVEFRVDEENTYLMEVNTRFWGSLQLAIDSGVDFPWLLYQIACGEETARISEYRTGRRLRWLMGDTRWLILLLGDKNCLFIDKLKAVLSFITPHPFVTRFEIMRFSDLRPFFWEIRRDIARLLNRRAS